MSTRTDRAADGIDLALVLPDEWWVVRLGERARRERDIDGLVAHQFRGVDDQPLLRDEVRRTLRAQTEHAEEAGGRRLAVSLMQSAGVPITATLTLYVVSLGPPVRMRNHVDGVYADLADDHGPSTGPGRTRWDFVELAAGPTLRRIRSRGHADDPDLVPEDTDVLLVDYWIEMPDHLGLAQVAFSTGLAAWEQPMTDLFDAIVSTARWENQPA